MSKNDEKKEQRQNKRYDIKSGAFALLKSDDMEILGSIQDISSGGISFSHIDEHKEINEPSRLTVNLISKKICYENFPSRNIWDHKEDGGFSAALVKMRRRGIQFELLTPEKQLQLKEFIDLLTKK